MSNTSLKIKKTGKALSWRNGFTLSEVMITVVIFLLFMMSLLGMLIMGLRYLNKANSEIIAQQNCRNILETITTELRQAMPNPAPGITGYLSISPPVEPTAVLYPNNNVKTANYIKFTEPNFSYYDPSSLTFNAADPQNYQQVKYYINNNVLYREVKTIDSAGTLSEPTSFALAETPGGSLSMTAKYLTSNKFEISVTVTENKGHDTEATYTGTEKVFIAVN